MTMALDPEEAVFAQLGDAVDTLKAGESLFRGPPREPDGLIKARACFVLGTGGPENFRLMGGDFDSQVATVQVTVRVDGPDYLAGRTLAEACRAALHAQELDGWAMVTVREPSPTYLKPDEAGRHSWSINAELRRLLATV